MSCVISKSSLFLDDSHFLVIELNEVVNDQIIPVLEDLDGCDHASYTVVEDVSVLRSKIEEDVLGLNLLGEINGSASEDHAIFVPKSSCDLGAFLVELEDPNLSGEPHWAAEGEFVLKKFLEQDHSWNGLVLKDSLKNESELLESESSEEKVNVLSQVLVVVRALHHVNCDNDQVNVLN